MFNRMKNSILALLLLPACFSDNVPSYDEPVEPDVAEEELIQNPIFVTSANLGQVTSDADGWNWTQSPEMERAWFNGNPNATSYDLQFFNLGPLPGDARIAVEVRRKNDCNMLLVSWHTESGFAQAWHKHNPLQSQWSQCGQNGWTQLGSNWSVPALPFSNSTVRNLKVRRGGSNMEVTTGSTVRNIVLPAAAANLVGPAGIWTNNGVYGFLMDLN